jgi:hypothetical protein
MSSPGHTFFIHHPDCSAPCGNDCGGREINLKDRFDAVLLRDIRDRAIYMRTVGGSCSDRRPKDELIHPADMTGSGLTAELLVALVEAVLLHAPVDCFIEKE